MSRDARTLSPSRMRQRGFAPRIAALVKSYRGGQARIRERARRHHGIVNLNVIRHLFLPEADGMNRNVPITQRRNGVEINSAGIISAVAKQHDRADGQIACFSDELFQAVADAGYGSRRVQFGEAADRVARLSRL